jgi:predicted transcriptional regulator of viral defense system
VVATWQLKDRGYSHGMLCDRAAAGRLHRIQRGVYAVGYRRISQKGRWMAAVLACGPGALLSHRAAIALWNLRPRSGGLVDVTSTRGKHGQPGIRVHNVRSLSAAERTVLDGIPVTSLERTLLDYAAVALEQQLRHALETSERREPFEGTAIAGDWSPSERQRSGRR